MRTGESFVSSSRNDGGRHCLPSNTDSKNRSETTERIAGPAIVKARREYNLSQTVRKRRPRPPSSEGRPADAQPCSSPCTAVVQLLYSWPRTLLAPSPHQRPSPIPQAARCASFYQIVCLSVCLSVSTNPEARGVDELVQRGVHRRVRRGELVAPG
eukprot:scaffold111546_cov72-Phaeocystis_antarctica.AAC.1